MQEQLELNARKQHQRIQEEQRKFRNLESDQKYYTDEIMIFIKKQKGTVQKLLKQNSSLKDVITKLYEKKGEVNKNQEVEETNKIKCIKEQIKEERQKQDLTRTHISNFQKKIVEKKNYFGGYNSGSEIEMNLQKQIRILENRLDKANQKFNEAIAFNKELKSNIQGLRKERKIFDALYDKLEKELQNKRKSMANIIEKTNNAYEERDRANYNIDVLRQDSKKETIDFQKELKEVSHIILKSKLSTTLVPTIAKKQESDQTNNFLEDPTTKTLTKSLKQMKNKMYMIQSEKLQKYREDFAKIEAATEVENFKDLIKIFIENQEKNFKIFRFINEQSNEIEELTEGIDKLKEEILEYQRVVKNPLKEKENTIAQIKERLRMETRNMNLEEEANKKLSRTITNIITQIENLFDILECDPEVAKQLSGTKIISDSNMVVFLAIIQEKILKLVSMYKNKTKQAAFSENETQDDLQHIYLGNQKKSTAKKSPEHLLLLESDEEDEDQLNNLMTYQDFMKKASEKIHEQSQKKKAKSRGRKKHDYKLY